MLEVPRSSFTSTKISRKLRTILFLTLNGSNSVLKIENNGILLNRRYHWNYNFTAIWHNFIAILLECHVSYQCVMHWAWQRKLVEIFDVWILIVYNGGEIFDNDEFLPNFFELGWIRGKFWKLITSNLRCLLTGI